jgi:hypothetical protein
MKNIIPALNKLQLACQDGSLPMSAIGAARKELFFAIREAITEAALCATKDTAQAASGVGKKEDNLIAFMAKFDKLNSD